MTIGLHPVQAPGLVHHRFLTYDDSPVAINCLCGLRERPPQPGPVAADSELSVPVGPLGGTRLGLTA